MIPFVIIVAGTILFFVLERVLPGIESLKAPGWYSAFLESCQIGIVLLAGVAWNRWLQAWTVFHISKCMPPFLQGFFGWPAGTFVFYWWHRARHDFNTLWRVCHQVHHSPARISPDLYKHPIDQAATHRWVPAFSCSPVWERLQLEARGSTFSLYWVSISITVAWGNQVSYSRLSRELPAEYEVPSAAARSP